MLFKNDEVTYSDIIMHDFIFLEHYVPNDFLEYIYGLKFEDNKDDEIRFKIRGARSKVKERICSLLCELPVDREIKKCFNEFRYDINLMTKGESVPMHNETRLISPFEICFWLTRTDDFKGRDFIIQKNNKEQLIKPYTGLFCFINTLVSDSYHGVSTLLTDTQIVTITGGLGNKFAYDKKH
jgi:hypothetical protein